MMLRFGSVCSGMEAASLAWLPLGWECAFVSEIDKAPCALLAQRFPDVPNFGDMTQFKDWPDAAIDVLVGGTPCQSFSVAGLRKGLADPRGSLMLVFGAIARRYRPRWIVWENVPGVLSADEGRAFGAFLGMLGELGYGFAYRVLDAQYFGLAQRRARVFVVGYLGDWRPPAAVLFERESLRGDSPPRRQTGQDLAGVIDASAGGSDENDTEQSRLVAATLNAHGGGHGRIDAESETFKVGALRAAGGGSSRDYLAFNHNARADEMNFDRDTTPTLSRSQGAAVGSAYAVRRLTPTECERLQGAPDGHTAIMLRGKPIADGPRYKMIGNSMAVPVMRWIGERIDAVRREIAAESHAPAPPALFVTDAPGAKKPLQPE